MDFEVTTRKPFVAKIDDKIYNLQWPTVGTIADLDERLKEVDEGDTRAQFNLMAEWLEQHGLPKEISKAFSLSDYVALIEKLSGQKKS